MSTDAPIFYDTGELVDHVRAAHANERVVLASGCFDPLHVGHVRYLRGAKLSGTFLVVAVNDDASTRRLKGPNRPVLSDRDRATLLAHMEFVNAVLVFAEEDVRAVLRSLRPDVHAKGTNYTVETVPERDLAVELGIETVIVGDPKDHASREIVSRIRGGSGDSSN